MWSGGMFVRGNKHLGYKMNKCGVSNAEYSDKLTIPHSILKSG